MESLLIGRHNELKRFEEYMHSKKAEFVMVYGRHRVGRTFLIRKAFDKKFTFQLPGYANVNTKELGVQFYITKSNC